LDLDAADAQSAFVEDQSMRAKIDEYEVLSVTGGQCSQLRFDCIAKHTVVVLLPDVLLSCSYFCCRVVCCCGSASEKMGGYLRERIDVSGKVHLDHALSPQPALTALCAAASVLSKTQAKTGAPRNQGLPPLVLFGLLSLSPTLTRLGKTANI